MSNNNSNNRQEKLYFNFLGMRTIKTVLSVFICFMISLVRDTSPTYSVIAALLATKEDHRLGISYGKNRIIGTILGGILGFVVVMLLRFLGLEMPGFLYYLIISLAIIPLIYLNVELELTSAITISCVVFYSVTISHLSDANPLFFVINRVLETIIGLVVSIVVNRAL